MSWLSSIGIAILTAVVSAVAAGFVAAGSVQWHRISRREGQSAYFIIFIGLLGLAAGFIGGLVIARGCAAFWTGLGVSAASMLGLAALAALIAWRLADIPPRFNGHELNLVVEVRLPPGAPQPSGPDAKPQLIFSRGAGAGARHSFGELEIANAHMVDGCWIIPGSVRIVSTRNPRSLTVGLDGNMATGFRLNFPRRPGEKHKQWSGWLPDWPQYPADRMKYRFRIAEIIPPLSTPPGPPAGR